MGAYRKRAFSRQFVVSVAMDGRLLWLAMVMYVLTCGWFGILLVNLFLRPVPLWGLVGMQKHC
jgi:hypothetical protein